MNDGVEPSAEMAAIAVKRGLKVCVTDAESADFGNGTYDTILFNGSPAILTILHRFSIKHIRLFRRVAK